MSGDRESTWYVKASFGAEWGPMTTATFLEMDERGSLGPGDMARCGVNGEWRPVSDFLVELATASASDASGSERCDDSYVGDDVLDASDDRIVAETPSATEAIGMVASNSRGSGALPGWSNFWVDSPAIQTNPVAANASVNDDVQLAEQDDPELPADDLTLPDKDVELLNDWKVGRTDELTRLKAIVADREAAIARAAEATRAAEFQAAAELAAAEAARAESRLKVEAPVVRPRRMTRKESWEQSLTRWKRSLPDWRVAIALVLLPALVWVVWPVSYGGVADTYYAMYQKLREIRDRPSDKTGMTEFVERSQVTLDTLLPRLEKRANSKDPDTLLLLWIGRDCLRPMLKSPRTRDTKHEAMLKKLLAQWDEQHHIVRTEEPTESNHPKSAEPEILTPPPGSKPLGFGQSANLGESAEPDLPAEKQSSQRDSRRIEDKDEN